LTNNLQVGQPVNKAYRAAVDFIAKKNADVHCHSNFGFGIGFQFKEDALLINESNETLVKPGMTFHCRVALSSVHKDAARSVVAIGDTYTVTEQNTV